VADTAVINVRKLDNVHPIIGVLAMDVPYLGIHPHVILSGLSSLFVGDRKPEMEVNDPTKVDLVAHGESSDDTIPMDRSPNDSHVDSTTTLATPHESTISKAFKFLGRYSHDKHPISASYRWLSDYFEFGSAVIDREGLNERFTALTNWSGEWVHFYTHTVAESHDEDTKYHITPYLPSFPDFELPRIGSHEVETQPFHPELHAEPVGDGSALEFDLFKAAAAKAKAKKKAKQKASWHKKDNNQHTHLEVPPEHRSSEESVSINVIPRPSSPTPSLRSSSSQYSLSRPPSIASEELPTTKQHSRKHFRHFIVLPRTLTLQWQSVPIAGVDNEVAAHTGIFFRHQNLEYGSFVPRVGSHVLKWVAKHTLPSP